MTGISNFSSSIAKSALTKKLIEGNITLGWILVRVILMYRRENLRI